MSIIDKFSELTKPTQESPEYRFDDTTLRKVVKETGKSLEEVVDTIVKFYLRSFPSTNGSLLFSQSKELKKSYALLHPLYRDVVQALSVGENVADLKTVKGYLGGFSGLGASSKKCLIEQLKQQALMVHEVTRTFPTRFAQVSKWVKFSDDDMTQDLMDYLDGETDSYDATKMAPFFYKHLALPGKTWAVLTQEWAATGGDGERLSKLIELFPLNWVFPIRFVLIKQDHFLTFRAYTEQKTWEVFLEMLGVQTGLLSPKALEDEEFRIDLVFHLLAYGREGLIAEKPDPQTKAYSWLLAARQFLRLQNAFSLGTREEEVFNWCMYAKQQDPVLKNWDDFSVLEPIEKSSVDTHMALIENVKEGMEEEDFLQYALIYFLILEEQSKQGQMQSTYHMLEQFNRTYCAFDPEELRAFLVRSCNINFTLSKKLPELLSDLDCTGKSPLFFQWIIGFSQYEDIKKYVKPTKEILSQLNLFPLDTHGTLMILSNVMDEKIQSATLNLLSVFEERFEKLSQEDRVAFLCSELITFPRSLSEEVMQSVLEGLEKLKPKLTQMLPWQLMGMGCFLASLNDREKIEKKVSQMTENALLTETNAFPLLADNTTKIEFPDGLTPDSSDAILLGLGQLNEKFTISEVDRKEIANYLASLKDPQKIEEKVSSVLKTHPGTDERSTLTATQFAQQGSASSALSSN
ncbi:MAG: hypothetical protein K1000chlam2_01365 [Chlamydiae bacterium]|nr:hypothetical protein [Chlamydiota bacterium]